ncbi:homoserine dehydrogenase [Chloroflexia bacterium SDU3-3]|nr:homoserine dehydrogenase [Chloroflexia bacterium SDU3-3]
MSIHYRVILTGVGSVGRGFAEIVARRQAWIEQHQGVRILLVGAATRSWCCYNPGGLDVAAVLQASERRDYSGLPDRQPWSPAELIANAEADVLAEASPTDFATAEPATGYMRAALGRGMHVVTANKGPVALHGPALRQEAAARGLSFGYEGTVMAGTPSLRLGWSALAGCELREVRGIVNGTTNYILTQMEGGLPYAEALAEAQRLGYAETDPTGDVEGYDAAGKAAILATMLMGGSVLPDQVWRTGITGITPADIAAAAQAGERWKLIARVARAADGSLSASVEPMRVPMSHPLAHVSGATNALTYTTDLLGDVTLIGPGAGGTATGFALLSDILAIPR